jgi:transcriptional regulator with XRE-family HTH domain
MQDVGKLIKEARLAKGLTQEELGNLVGVQKSAIAKYENGRVVNIKRSTLQGLAKALDLRGSDLIDEEIKNDPKATGEKIADMLRNQDLLEIMELYMSFNDEKRKQVKDFMLFLSK